MDKPQHDKKPGPNAERLRLPFADWKEAIRKALERERPEDGWPDEDESDDGEDSDREDD